MDTAWLTKAKIAHRGLHTGDGISPENSMDAFKRARNKGYGMEFDLRLLKDGTVVVFHDATLDRMTGLSGLVSDLILEDLQEGLLVNGTRMPIRLKGSQFGIPTLKELLEEINGQVPLMLELKIQGAVGPLEEAVFQLLQNYRGPFSVQSFHPYSVKWFADHAPDFVRGQLAESFTEDNMPWFKKVLMRNMFLNRVTKPHYVNYDIRRVAEGQSPEKVLVSCKEKGIPVLGWTARTRAQYEAACTFYDNVLFEGFEP